MRADAASSRSHPSALARAFPGKGIKQIIHLLLHFVVPAVIVALFYRKNWKTAYPAMAAAMLVDIDHILADPIYDPNRCSIGMHPLHGVLPIALYGLLCLLPKSRVVGIGLITHMALDSMDCRWTSGVWFV